MSNEPIPVPKWLQNDLYDKTSPFVERTIAAHEKEQIGFSRFSLNNMALQAAAIGYHHAIPNPPEDKPVNHDLFSKAPLLLTSLVRIIHNIEADDQKQLDFDIQDAKELINSLL